MLKNYFKIAWRNIVRHNVFAVFFFSGFSVGIAACLLIYVVIQYELSFNTYQPNFKNIYHVVSEQSREGDMVYNPGVPVPETEALRLDFPQLKVTSLVSSYGSQITVPDGNAQNGQGDKKFSESLGVVFVEPQYFDIFGATWLVGGFSVLFVFFLVVFVFFCVV